MPLISLPYGKEQMTTDISDNRLSGIMQATTPRRPTGKSEAKIVRDAILNPVNSPPLKELARGKKNVVILSDYHSFPRPDQWILPELVMEIRAASPEASITILLESGFPTPLSQSKLKQKLGKSIWEDPCLRVVAHADHHSEETVSLGSLPSGADLKINKLAADADLLIGENFVEPNYLCGYWGGGCCILPGISSSQTVMPCLSSRIVDDKHTRAGILDGNPIYGDIVEAARKAKLAFIVNVALNSKKEIVFANAGNYVDAHKKCCEDFESFSKVDPILSDIIITAGGGYPFDQTICQSIKGLIPAEVSCRQGGVIILAASCKKGCGPGLHYEAFAGESSKERIMLRILDTAADKTVLNQWIAQVLCRILIQFKVIMVTDAPEYIVRAMHMDYAPNLEQAIEMADDYLGRKYHRITVIPDGTSIVVRKNNQT